MSSSSSRAVDILILGAGWTASFLAPLCTARNVVYAATTRDGRDGTIPFAFDPESDDNTSYRPLPDATTVLITFPITQAGGSARLVKLYNETRQSTVNNRSRFIQLGTSSMWGNHALQGVPRALRKQANENKEPAPQLPIGFKWYDRNSDMTPSDRSNEEDELLKLSPSVPTTVLNLTGLWGGQRQPRKWIGRVAATKEMLQSKGSLHLIHGHDLARAILAVHDNFDESSGQRWLLNDMRCYDWWDLAHAWSSGDAEGAGGESDRGPQAKWVQEFLLDEGIRGLPRNVELLGRALDSREFWSTFKLVPQFARVN
ncbi:hypothetical protein BDV98DRAFT_650811 [Pterulicium gracile]|uniref:Uncharacterized protein n=1 Tax=Pterulicium gracile TaxID=1884261 RepID=A0A5C3QLT4_9AGAR|nr:hypothetical protein BDV98DRAFT_650811 [Pterula gracilis]